jgi:hypothetical protein
MYSVGIPTKDNCKSKLAVKNACAAPQVAAPGRRSSFEEAFGHLRPLDFDFTHQTLTQDQTMILHASEDMPCSEIDDSFAVFQPGEWAKAAHRFSTTANDFPARPLTDRRPPILSL